MTGIDLFDARCGLDSKGYTKPSYQSAHLMVFPRSGAYLAKVNHRECFMDGTSVLLMRPGDEFRVAHPLGCGDTFTALDLSAEVAAEWPLPGPQVPVDDRLDLRHRALVAACRRGVDGLAVADQVYALLDQLFTGRDDRSAGAGRPATMLAHRRLVARAREALVAGGFAVGLDQLAALVGCSPHHLSRVFRQVTGETLTTYRNRLRVRAVLADLQDGADNLRTLAADYGFADQAHLTRVIRRQLGQPPGAVRRMLAGPVNRA